MITLNNNNEFNQILQNNKVVIDFYAKWCKPCSFISPYYEKLSNEFPNITFVKVDIEQAPDIADKCNISCLPSFQFYNNKSKINELNGADEKVLKEYINNLNNI
jgi:thioredoxin 1